MDAKGKTLRIKFAKDHCRDVLLKIGREEGGAAAKLYDIQSLYMTRATCQSLHISESTLGGYTVSTNDDWVDTLSAITVTGIKTTNMKKQRPICDVCSH